MHAEVPHDDYPTMWQALCLGEPKIQPRLVTDQKVLIADSQGLP